MIEYDVVIGLEVHVQARSASKMFCSCANKYGVDPNTNVCPVCMGYPGVMPVPNKTAIESTIIAGLMCGCTIPNYSKFDRKSYFYPDMPKNYQITQFDFPFCLNGSVHIFGKGFSGKELEEKYLGITRIHLEEDVAKSTHFPGYSGIDFNRAGVPLMEVVSEPDMTTADEAYAYLTALKQVMEYADISDCDMEKGQMRCDVNVSLKPKGQKEFGTKIEIKNLNSFRAAHKSLVYEIKRQTKLLNAGEVLQQETRGWNDDKGQTYLMRTKEDAHDYRYFPEPDLMPVIFSDEEIEAFKAKLPEHPEVMCNRFVKEFGLTLYDAQVLTAAKPLADYFEAGAKKSSNKKKLANWIISELLRELGSRSIDISKCKIEPEQLGLMVQMIEDGKITGKIAKTVFAEMFKSGEDPQIIVEREGLAPVSDSGAIEAFVDTVIKDNPDQVQQFKDGKSAVLQYFVGQVMKLSRGKANPQMAVELVKKKLDD